MPCHFLKSSTTIKIKMVFSVICKEGRHKQYSKLNLKSRDECSSYQHYHKVLKGAASSGNWNLNTNSQKPAVLHNSLVSLLQLYRLLSSIIMHEEVTAKCMKWSQLIFRRKLQKQHCSSPYMMILHRYRFPLVHMHLPPLQQSCQPGSCSPWRWRCSTASERFCKGSQRANAHWRSEDIRIGCKKSYWIHNTFHTFNASLT